MLNWLLSFAFYCANVNTRFWKSAPAERDDGDTLRLGAVAVFEWVHCMPDSPG